ncbi:MAG: discoidin domain-containing protein [Planctomycetaceae bacterium]|nr:discoidin domain-containing protein [Planctomycetaceae bacterium]
MKSFLSTIPFLLGLFSWVDANNMALLCQYNYTPEPKYQLTSDALDKRQLTDGISDKSLWYQSYREKTVGWFTDEIIEITLDLGAKRNVDGIKIHTIGGGKAGVEYPEYIIGLASMDGRRFSLVSLIDSDALKSRIQNLAEPKVLELSFGTQCRYVKMLIRPNGYLFFSDELEVIESPETCPVPNTSSMLKPEAVDYAERIRQLCRNMTRLQTEDRNSNNQALSPKAADHIARIDEFKRHLGTWDELHKLENQVDLFRAEFLNARSGTSWFCTEADPVDVLRFADLPRKAGDCELDFYQWQNEYGVAALNLTNCSQQALEYRLSVSPIAGTARNVDSNDLVSIRRACYVRSKNAGLFADALVLQNSAPFKVKAGETLQLWVELFSKDLPAGNYAFAVAVQCDGQSEKTIESIPVRATIADKVFPGNLDFMTCNWDYISDTTIFTAARPQLAVEDLKTHHVNVTVIPPGKIFRAGSSKSSFTDSISDVLKKELDLRRHARLRLFFLALNNQDKVFGANLFSSEWDARFRTFMQQLIGYLSSLGYGFEDYAIYPYDEYIGEKFVHVARIIRDIDPRVKIFANSYRADMKEVRKAFGLVDIWCPYFPDIQNKSELLTEIREHCDVVWCYHTDQREDYVLENPGKLNRRYHRILPLTAKALGLKGAAFWTYCDWRGGHFDYNDKRVWGVVYDGRYAPMDCIKESIIPSKRWQLWREGVEDAVCLDKHQTLLDEFRQKPNNQLSTEYLISLRKRADEPAGD